MSRREIVRGSKMSWPFRALKEHLQDDRLTPSPGAALEEGEAAMAKATDVVAAFTPLRLRRFHSRTR